MVVRLSFALQALACYLLRLTPTFAGAPVVRTRDPAVLATVICKTMSLVLLCYYL